MDSNELKKDHKDDVPRYRVRGRFNNRTNKNIDNFSFDKREHIKSDQHEKGKQKTYKKSDNSDELTDKEKLKVRTNRFSNDNMNYKSTKTQYGYVSRGEDNRLQRSHKDRLQFFNDIVSSFIRYSNENTSSNLNKDFDRFINKSDISPESQEPGILEISTIDSILNSLRKLREALLYEKVNEFTKKIFLFSIRVSVNIGHYQTYIPSITYLLRSNNSLLLTETERQEIATILVLHIAHFNGENSKALQLYFKYINAAEIKTLQILKSWIYKDYYSWIQYYNSETDNGKAFIMKFGLTNMVTHMVNAISNSYFSFNLQDFENNYLPNGYSYTQLCEKYNISWKLDNNTIVVRERNTK